MKIIGIKFIRLFTGFFLAAVGIYFMRQAQLGLNPWGTFHDGFSKLTGLRFGTISQLTGLVIIILSIALKIYPSIGTLLNIFFIGFFINLIEILNLVPAPEHILLKLCYLIGGIWLLAFGLYLYMTAKLGAGPRDGLMLGLVKKTPFSVTVIKTAIELSALTIGFLLGGSIGIGTIISALLSGFSLHTIFKLMKFDPKEEKHLNFKEFINLFATSN